MIPNSLVLRLGNSSFLMVKPGGQFHRFHQIIRVLARRPSIHAFSGGSAHPLEFLRMREGVAKNRGHCVHVPCRKYVASFALTDEIVFRTNPVTHGDWTTAKHGFVHDEPEWFVK